MTFGVGGQSGDKFTCVVKDETSIDFQSSRHTTYHSTTTSVRSFYQEIASDVQYRVGTFLLVWRCPNGDEEELDDTSSKTLSDLGLTFGKSNQFRLTQKDGDDPVKDDCAFDDATGGGLQPSQWNTGDTASSGSAADTSAADSERWLSTVTHSSPIGSQVFVGLVNQAMTCYLNSLLQTLYMTPEFRNALYRWRFDGSTAEEEERSIPYQLQKLFAILQTSGKQSAETTDVTKSFGWTSADAWQQHDVQELCRVMFDALEKKFKGTEQDNLIKRLYEGKMQDYVRCLECDHERARTDSFLDVPLVIKPFGAEKACGSVEEALKLFIRPEKLDGSNQYMCEKCNKKVDAHKGLKFLSFPYLLTLQLKRFDFDYTTMGRIKLNDRVTFPKTLSLSEYLAGGGKLCETVSSVDGSGAERDAPLGQQPVASVGEAHETPSAATPESCAAAVGGTDRAHAVANSSGDAVDCAKESSVDPPDTGTAGSDGQHEYQLFSIMVHSGSAVGGHYYAYIRSFEDDSWYSFNDMSVSPISDRDIEKTFGSGDRSPLYSYSSMYTSSANAYMLMYRQVDKDRNVLPLSDDALPQHVHNIVQRISEQEEAERRQVEYDRSMWKSKVYMYDESSSKYVERPLCVRKDTALRDALKEAHKIWELEGVVPLECCRLVKFDYMYSVPEKSFEGLEDVAVSKVANNSLMYCELLLETRSDDAEFEPYIYSGTGCYLKVFLVNLESGLIVAKRPLRAELHWTVRELREWLGKKLSYSHEGLRVCMDRFYSAPLLLADDTATLKEAGFYCSNKVYVAPALRPEDIEDGKGDYHTSRLASVLDTFLHSINLTVILPAEDDIAPYRMPSSTSQEQQQQEEAVSDPLSQDCPGAASASDGDKTADTTDKAPAKEASRITVLTVDKRMTMEKMKEKISGMLHVDVLAFKMIRLYSNNHEFEVHRLSETLMQYDDKSKLRIVMGRALQPGDFNIKVHLFQLRKADAVTSSPAAVNEPAASTDSTGSTGSASNADSASNAETSSSCDDAGSTGNGHEAAAAAPTFATVPVGPGDKYLFDTVVSKGMTVLDAKRNMLAEAGPHLAESLSRDVSLFRLRKKSWKCPATVLLDDMKFGDDINLYSNWEVFLQPIPSPEPMASSLEIAAFIQRWYPSTYSLGEWDEIILKDKLPSTLTAAISEKSGIPADHVAFARSRSSFPIDIALMELPDQDWDPKLTSLGQQPVLLSDDGAMFFYYDTAEERRKLTDSERRKVQKQDTARLGHTTRYSLGYKEKALKIYTSMDD